MIWICLQISSGKKGNGPRAEAQQMTISHSSGSSFSSAWQKLNLLEREKKNSFLDLKYCFSFFFG